MLTRNGRIGILNGVKDRNSYVMDIEFQTNHHGKRSIPCQSISVIDFRLSYVINVDANHAGVCQRRNISKQY